MTLLAGFLLRSLRIVIWVKLNFFRITSYCFLTFLLNFHIMTIFKNRYLNFNKKESLLVAPTSKRCIPKGVLKTQNLWKRKNILPVGYVQPNFQSHRSKSQKSIRWQISKECKWIQMEYMFMGHFQITLNPYVL